MNPGTRLGPYEIVSALGEGGMGEVYKARDTRLDRSVAVKILPPDFAGSAQLRARFEREAKVISQLTHPHICTLYDVGENYLVMELLEGETLADRLTRGPMALPDVLRYGAQIAEALSRAHRAGVVHRDVKPGNIMITKSGAKLLDFGLAKSAMPAVDLAGATQHKPLTQEGTILGTFQYMAPEQLEGAEADARTDIFALGVVLYEMTTGRRAFEGKTRTSLIAAIVSGSPQPLAAVQPLTPPAFEHLVNKCLEKEPDSRWQDAADVASELRWIATGQELPVRRASSRAAWVVAAAALVAAIGAMAFALSRPPKSHPVYTEIAAPDDAQFAFDNGPAAISPDGTMLVYPAWSAGNANSLWLRRFDGAPPRAMKGTENGSYPFWSPDSRSLAYFSVGKLKRLDVGTGTIETIADAPVGRGGSWSKDNWIVFAPVPADGLYLVSATGGTPKKITELSTARGDSSHRFPVFLPDGRHFLAFLQGPTQGGNIMLASLNSKEVRVVATADGGVVAGPPGVILSVRDRVLRAHRLHPKTFAFEGEPVPLAEEIQISTTFNFVNVSASQNGILAYVRGGSATSSEIVFFDSTGKRLNAIGHVGDQLDPKLSPDGTMMVFSENAGLSSTADVWAFDLRRNIATQLSFSPHNDFAPVWSPDGKAIVYTTFANSPGDLLVKRIDGTGNGTVLVSDRRRKVASDWTRDGKYVIYNAMNTNTIWDVEAYSLAERKIIPLAASPAAEVHGRVSPDGKWLAYSSMETGISEVFVQPFARSGQRWQVSGGGGVMPVWAHDGGQLFYIAPDGKMMSAAVQTKAEQFDADAPRALFQTGIRMMPGVTRGQYDVAADGRFLINVASPQSRKSVPITFVQNWMEKMPR